jgi:hypothetical protein
LGAKKRVKRCEECERRRGRRDERRGGRVKAEELRTGSGSGKQAEELGKQRREERKCTKIGRMKVRWGPFPV